LKANGRNNAEVPGRNSLGKYLCSFILEGKFCGVNNSIPPPSFSRPQLMAEYDLFVTI
jgi:hypothetical protein